MAERNTDVAALAAGALAATLSMVTASGPYSLLSCAISISLATIVATYIIGRPRDHGRRLAVSMVGALTLLPLAGWAMPALPAEIVDGGLFVIWIALTGGIFVLDRYRGGRTGLPPPVPAPEEEDDAASTPVPYDEDRWYKAAKPLVHGLRTIVQMGIGVAIFVALGAKLGGDVERLSAVVE